METGVKVLLKKGRSNVTGVIVGLSTFDDTGNLFIVEWDDESVSKNYDYELKEFKSEMDLDFEQAVEKVRAARTLIVEAHMIAEKHFRNLGEAAPEIRDLMRDLNNNGWVNSRNCY